MCPSFDGFATLFVLSWFPLGSIILNLEIDAFIFNRSAELIERSWQESMWEPTDHQAFKAHGGLKNIPMISSITS